MCSHTTITENIFFTIYYADNLTIFSLVFRTLIVMDQLSFVFVLFVTVTVTLALAAPSDSMTVKIREECKKLPGPPAQLVRF